MFTLTLRRIFLRRRHVDEKTGSTGFTRVQEEAKQRCVMGVGVGPWHCPASLCKRKMSNAKCKIYVTVLSSAFIRLLLPTRLTQLYTHIIFPCVSNFFTA